MIVGLISSLLQISVKDGKPETYKLLIERLVLIRLCFFFNQNKCPHILYKWFFSRVLKFANVHCRPGSREFIFAVKYIQLSPKLTTCSN